MHKGRILLVDDDPNVTYILGMILKLNDFDVYPYTDPEVALADFRKDRFDLLLLDIRMPEMTGFELYRKMKEIDKSAKVCFITDYSKEYLQEFKRSFPELADENFANKPAVPTDLLKIVGAILVDSDGK
jgi:DNA-binding response OmpR family regulator